MEISVTAVYVDEKAYVGRVDKCVSEKDKIVRRKMWIKSETKECFLKLDE